ncbi:MAG: putative toxin-antitoxin system toxin component, PIN family [bacterium]
MRVVADTNMVISGLLWRGPPRQILEEVRAGEITLFTSAMLSAELEEVLHREKFAQRLEMAVLRREIW